MNKYKPLLLAKRNTSKHLKRKYSHPYQKKGISFDKTQPFNFETYDKLYKKVRCVNQSKVRITKKEKSFNNESINKSKFENHLKIKTYFRNKKQSRNYYSNLYKKNCSNTNKNHSVSQQPLISQLNKQKMKKLPLKILQKIKAVKEQKLKQLQQLQFFTLQKGLGMRKQDDKEVDEDKFTRLKKAIQKRKWFKLQNKRVSIIRSQSQEIIRPSKQEKENRTQIQQVQEEYELCNKNTFKQFQPSERTSVSSDTRSLKRRYSQMSEVEASNLYDQRKQEMMKFLKISKQRKRQSINSLNDSTNNLFERSTSTRQFIIYNKKNSNFKRSKSQVVARRKKKTKKHSKKVINLRQKSVKLNLKTFRVKRQKKTPLIVQNIDLNKRRSKKVKLRKKSTRRQYKINKSHIKNKMNQSIPIINTSFNHIKKKNRKQNKPDCNNILCEIDLNQSRFNQSKKKRPICVSLEQKTLQNIIQKTKIGQPQREKKLRKKLEKKKSQKQRVSFFKQKEKSQINKILQQKQVNKVQKLTRQLSRNFRKNLIKMIQANSPQDDQENNEPQFQALKNQKSKANKVSKIAKRKANKKPSRQEFQTEVKHTLNLFQSFKDIILKRNKKIEQPTESTQSHDKSEITASFQMIQSFQH